MATLLYEDTSGAVKYYGYTDWVGLQGYFIILKQAVVNDVTEYEYYFETIESNETVVGLWGQRAANDYSKSIKLPFDINFKRGGTTGAGGGSSAWNDITGKPSTFPPSNHAHAISGITGLSTALATINPIPVPLANQTLWENKFDKNYVVGTSSAPITGNINAPDLIGAVEGAQVEIYWQDSTKANFLSELYRRTDGMDLSINTLNRIILTYKGGVVHVEGARVLSVGTASPTITGGATLAVGNVVAVSVIGAAGTTYQWQRLSGSWGNIAGATNSNYTVQGADASTQIRCQVLYREDGFQSALVTTPAKSVSAAPTKTSIIASSSPVFYSMTPNAVTGANFTTKNVGGSATGATSSPTTPSDWAVMIGFQSTATANNSVLFAMRNTGAAGNLMSYEAPSYNAAIAELLVYNHANALSYIMNDVFTTIFDGQYHQIFMRKIGTTFEIFIDDFVNPKRTTNWAGYGAINVNRFDVRQYDFAKVMPNLGASSYVALYIDTVISLATAASIAAAAHS